jgi:hypothetical protein
MIEAGFRWRVRITVLQVRSGQGNGEVRSLVGQVHYSAEVYVVDSTTMSAVRRLNCQLRSNVT